jgi:ADP-heptose:LPS heptosyltransferase
VLLVAPARPAAAVVGTGAAAADALLPWDGPAVAEILGGSRADAATEARIADCGTALVLSLSGELRRALVDRIESVRGRDPRPTERPPRHAAAWALDAAAPLLGSGGALLREPPPDLEPGAVAEREAEALLKGMPRGFLALHPGSGSPAKNWPAGRFGELARRLSPDREWLLVAGPADEEALESLGVPPGARLARELPLPPLAAVLGRAGLYVGNDSGVSHLAAAAGAPTLTLFGPTAPALWAPLGRRVEVVVAPGGRLSQLEVDDVESAARRLSDPRGS